MAKSKKKAQKAFKNSVTKTYSMSPIADEHFEKAYFSLCRIAQEKGEKCPTKGDFISKILEKNSATEAVRFFKA